MDYRKILVEYIKTVVAAEGTDFLNPYDRRTSLCLTEDEWSALYSCSDEAWVVYTPPTQDLKDVISKLALPSTPLMAAVKKGGVKGITPFPGFKEGQTVTGKGVKPGIVTISKDGTVVIVPKDEK